MHTLADVILSLGCLLRHIFRGWICVGSRTVMTVLSFQGLDSVGGDRSFTIYLVVGIRSRAGSVTEGAGIFLLSKGLFQV